MSFHYSLRFSGNYICDVTPFGPHVTSTSSTISLYGRWSTSGSDRGIAHFFTLQEYNRGSGRNKEQTNNMLGLIQTQERSYATLHFLCACVD